MKKILLAFALVASSIYVNGQCTTNNATDCKCKDSTQTDCDLLPDIEIGHPPFYIYYDNFGINEFAQSGNANPADNGKMYVTVSTPNVGHGPLEVHTTNIFVCGTDTIVGTAPAMCPDGVTYPRILINQRIFHRNSNGTMSYYDRPAGTMTYHPTHSHMHVDNWGNYTLRERDSLDSNPLHWPVIGSGTKLAYCLMDYGTCPGYPNHCLDDNGNSLNQSTNFPNYGLGGGNYGCSPVMQGISSGYVDVYWTSLAGMYITIPPNVCNGLYYIVCEVDPNHNFLEENDSNNVYAAPYILKRQVPNPASTPVNISISNSAINLCQGETVSLSAISDIPNVSYNWSNGATGNSISVNAAGTYSVEVSNQCGTGTSTPVQINVLAPTAAPTVVGDTIPTPGVAMLQANSANEISWYDQPVGGVALDTGDVFYTPPINTTTTFYAQSREIHPGAQFSLGLADNTVAGSGGYFSGDESLIFDCYNSFTLHTVKVYSPSGGNIIVELRDSGNNVLQTMPATLVAGANVVTLDFQITPGTNYRLARTGGDLYRNNSGTNCGYPFVLANFCTITGTTQNAGYYYFFYDWDIHLPDNICTSPRVPVDAVVSLPNAIADAAVLRSLVVYPNPAKNSVIISFTNQDKDAVIELIDALGKTVMRKEIHSAGDTFEETLNISSISRGVYNIHILSSGKNLYKRLIID